MHWIGFCTLERNVVVIGVDPRMVPPTMFERMAILRTRSDRFELRGKVSLCRKRWRLVRVFCSILGTSKRATEAPSHSSVPDPDNPLIHTSFTDP